MISLRILEQQTTHVCKSNVIVKHTKKSHQKFKLSNNITSRDLDSMFYLISNTDSKSLKKKTYNEIKILIVNFSSKNLKVKLKLSNHVEQYFSTWITNEFEKFSEGFFNNKF